MPCLPHDRPDVSPSVIAGLLLAARDELRRLSLCHPTVSEVLAATAAGKSRAYELKKAIEDVLPEIARPVGRPRTPSPPPASAADTAPLSQKALRFVAQHPGAIEDGAHGRRRYSDGFRRFVLGLCEQHPELELSAIAAAVCVPPGTLKDWLRGGDAQDGTTPDDEPTDTDQAACARIQTLLDAWKRWKGSFTAFCDHAQHHLRIPYGRTLIGSILEQHGVRIPRRRSGRSPDEKALRGAFETFFAGAQWEGDGSPIDVEVDGQRLSFNLELMVDAHTDAVVGASVRQQEDSTAVTEAFDDGIDTTGTPPLCVLLDNRPSNHTAEVDSALGDTLRMRSTVGRAQNKPHVEGSFGLFAQRVPPLAITTSSPRALACQVLMLVVTTFFRTLNHKPRRDRKRRSRVELYQADTPTAEQIDHARAALAERCRQQQLARKTREARVDPVVRQTLDDAFARLSLDDPEGNIRSAIARYPIDAVVAGIATFEGKRTARTLPPGASGRYLLGIVRNIALQDEGNHISEALLRERLAVRDRILASLQRARDTLMYTISDSRELLFALLDRALQADRRIDRLFWLQTAADHIGQQATDRHQPLLRAAARRIHATYAVPHRERLAAARFLATKVVPLT